MLKRSSLLFGLLFIISNLSLFANIKANVEIDTNNVLIGERITVTMSVQADKIYPLVWPQIKDSNEYIEVLEESLIDTTKAEKGIKLSKKLIITSFESGEYDLSPLTFLFEKEGTDDVYPILADLPVLKFTTVTLDSNATLKDIKAPLEEPITFRELLPWIALGLGIIGLIIFAIFLYKKYKAKKSEEQPILKYDPTIPPHILAYQQLKRLEDKKLWQGARFKDYYVELTQIIRLYIERRYSIMALEMTASELKDVSDRFAVNLDLKDRFNSMIEEADLVKFAKSTPNPNVCQLSIKTCFDFVETTKVNSDVINTDITE